MVFSLRLTYNLFVIDYIKEVFQQFTNNAIDVGTRSNEDEIQSYYSKLQSQADRGLLDEQLMKITPHNDLADLFEEFYNVVLVEEKGSKLRNINEDKPTNAAVIGVSLHNKLIKSTTLKLKAFLLKEIWSDKSVQIFDDLFNTEGYKEALETSKKYKSKLGRQFDYIWLDDNHYWFWLATGFVNAMIATHYRVMLKTGMSTIYAGQSRNIGELVLNSLNMEWNDEVYSHLGHIAMTAVVLGDLPSDTKLEIEGPFSAGPRGGNFQAASLIPAKNASPIFNIEKDPKEPCVGMSIFHCDNEISSQSDDVSDALSILQSIFATITLTFPKLLEEEWLNDDGYSFSEEDDDDSDEIITEVESKIQDENEEKINDFQEKFRELEYAKEGSEELIEDIFKTFRHNFYKARQGDLSASTIVGTLYRHTAHINKEHHKYSINWLTSAAEQEFAAAEYELGLLYLNESHPTLDYDQALYWLTKAAEQGNNKAQFELGAMFNFGTGVKQDYEKAFTWYKKAAEQGDPKAQCNLGLMIALGQGVARDHLQAFTWFEKAAIQGFSVAQNNIGNCYRDGNGVAVDFNKAFFWFKKAAESDNVFGQHSLGEMFINGFGVKKSLKDAAYWFNKTRNNPFKDDLAKDDIDLLDKLWANNELSKYLE